MSEPLEPVNILLVDDRPSNLMSLKEVLKRPDYRVVLADSGEDALVKVLREDFAVILLDVAMPRMDGLETAFLIKQRERSRHIPILFVTASVYDMNSIARAYEAGAVDYLQKPLEPFLVRAKVSVFVELYRQRRQIEKQAALLRESERREHEHGLRRREAERRRFLDEATEELFGSLETEETLRALARVSTRRLEHLAAVYAVEPEGLRLVDASAASQDDWPLYEKLELAEAVALPEGGILAGALERGEPQGLLGEAADALLALLGRRDPAEGAPAPHPGGVLLLPLSARGKALGVLLLVRRDGCYDEESVSIAEELSRRTLLALDNARLYEEARSAVRLRDEFMAIASHELRTPLTALHLNLQHMEKLLGGHPADSTAVRAKVKGSMRQTERLTRLVENLLDVSRIRAGRFELHLEEVNVADVVHALADRFRDQAMRVGCEIKVQIDGTESARWDRVRIEQTLDNLVGNALKYAPGSPVEIRAGVCEGQAQISVADHGRGVNRADGKRIFGPFERAVPIRNYGGLGLGLYIAQQIVHSHGGELVLSHQPEGGACFTVTLPLEVSDERPCQAEAFDLLPATQVS